MQNWPITSKRFVVFIDILGFKDLVYNSDHIEIKEKLEKISDIQKILTTTPENKDLVKTALFSDSILLISKDDSIDSTKLILQSANWLFGACLDYSVPIKGGMASGIMTADFEKSIFFGKPLIEAYILQENLKLYGIVLHHTAENDILKYHNDKTIADNIILYKTPIHNSRISHHLLNYTHSFAYVYKTPLETIQAIKQLYKGISGEPRKYVDNTIEYIENIINTKTA